MLVPIDQNWLLKTYERGRLISSISLTPQEEMTIEVFSWDRRKSSTEDTSTFDTESNAETQSVDRDTRDVFGELTKSGTLSWGLNGSLTYGPISIHGNAGSSSNVNNVSRN